MCIKRPWTLEAGILAEEEFLHSIMKIIIYPWGRFLDLFYFMFIFCFSFLHKTTIGGALKLYRYKANTYTVFFQMP